MDWVVIGFSITYFVITLAYFIFSVFYVFIFEKQISTTPIDFLYYTFMGCFSAALIDVLGKILVYSTILVVVIWSIICWFKMKENSKKTSEG